MKNRKKMSPMMSILVVFLVSSLIYSGFTFFMQKHDTEKVGYSEFITSVDEKKVDTAVIDEKESLIQYTLKGDEVKYYTTMISTDTDLTTRLEESGAKFEAVPVEVVSPFWSMLGSLAITIGMLMLMNWIFRKMLKKQAADNGINIGGGEGFGGFGKSNAKAYVPAQSGIKFADVAGQDEAKDSLVEIVDFLNNPNKYKKIGAQMPKGALLVGPPGTGKTLLAKAVAGEAGVPFFSISGSEFVEMFVGRGAARVRDLFKEARDKAPCIVFIDEIDTIGKKRDGGGFSGNDEREQTLNQLLAEMDGFDGGKGVVILAATNRPESLDAALLRPGRFDRRIPVELPDLAGREAILRVHSKKIKMNESVDLSATARATAGASGADLANIINESAILAVKNGRPMVYQTDLDEAVETVIAGQQKKGAVISPKEKMIVAYHEIGHALVAAKLKNSSPIHKITIIPRTKGSLGYTMQVPEEESNLMSKDELITRIVTLTGGRAAEQVIFNSITTGASNDIEQATKVARAMITRFGMSDSFGMTAFETINNQYLSGDSSLVCSDETSAKIDKEVVQLINNSYQQAIDILEENKTKLHELAKFLFEEETITGEQFMEILNRPLPIEDEEEVQ